MYNLVIVESPSKAKTIEGYLGKDYKVVSSVGHIRDLATSGPGGLGIDVENNYKPEYKAIRGKKKVINESRRKKQKQTEKEKNEEGKINTEKTTKAEEKKEKQRERNK